MARTFDSSQLGASLPQMNESLSHESSEQSGTGAGGGVTDDVIKKIHQKAAERKKNIYERHFGNLKPGTGGVVSEWSSRGGLLGGKRIVGVFSAMKNFRRDPSGGGRNLSNANIKHIGGKLVSLLKALPTKKSFDDREQGIPVKKQRKFVSGLKRDMKRGIISGSDVEDAKHMIKEIKI